MKIRRLLAAAALLVLAANVIAQPGENLPNRAFQRIGATKLRHGSRILSLAYSPDGTILAAGGGYDPVRIWNPKTGALIREINEPDVTCLAFSESGLTMLCAGYQKSIRLFDMQKNKEIGRLDGHKAAIKSIAVSPDTSTIASGSQDGLVYLWQWSTKRKDDAALAGHTDEVTAVAFSPDSESSLLATAGSDRVIILWNYVNHQQKLKLDAGCGVYAIAFSADGKTLYSAGDDYLIRRWDVGSGKQTGVFKGHDGIIVSLLVRGDAVISGALDRTVRFWDAKTTELRRTLPRGVGDCDALAVTKAGDFVAMAGLSNTVRIFDTQTGKAAVPITGPTAGLTTLALSGDHKRLASIGSDGQLLVWDPLDGKLLQSWDSKHTGETFLAFAPDGKTLATASNTVRVWNADTGTELAQLPIKATDPVVALAFSPDGRTLALGLRSSQIELWDVKTGKEGGSFTYQGFLHALAWSPDGKRLAGAGGAKIFIWDPQGRSLVRSFDVKEGPAPAFPMVATLAFAPDSRTLAAGCFDAVIRIYNSTAKTPADPLELKSCEGHLAVSYALAFSTDGRLLLSGSFDKTARLWEAFSGKSIAHFKGHVGPVMGVGFMPNSRSVFTGSTDTTIYQWDVPDLAGQGKLPAAAAFSFQELENAWAVLANEETVESHKMMWRCVANGKESIAHVLKQKKIYLLDPEQVKKLFKDLNSGVFVTRQTAMDKLSSYGRWMEGRYDAALANPPSLEYKRRVEILKEKLSKEALSLSEERLRLRRFMLICEQVGGAEAIEVLQQLANSGPEEDLRDEAKGSLQRLKHK